jgi:hypothetical protein
MPERGFRLGTWQMFAVLSVLAVAVIIVLVRTAPPGDASARRWSGGPRSSADSMAYVDSLFEAAERRALSETMTLAEVATRADIPADSLALELHLPATVSLTSPLRAILIEHHLTLQDVHDARQRLERRLGKPANLK